MLTEEQKIPIKNPEGYPDTTAHDALTRVAIAEQRANERHRKLVLAVLSTIDLAGFTLTNRLELMDRKTGKRYY